MRWQIGILTAAMLVVINPLQADDVAKRLEAYVVAAYNAEAAKVPEQLAPYADDLQETFGYSGFEVLGSDTRALDRLASEWLIPSREFYLKILAKSDSDWTRIYTELYREKKLLVGVDAQLVKDQPLLIRGPQWGRRQIIILIIAR